jgi:dihydrodipicolinate synthase/N-acetylneuraminate lyase
MDQKLKKIYRGNGVELLAFRSRNNPEKLDFKLTNLHAQAIINCGFDDTPGAHFFVVGGPATYPGSMTVKDHQELFHTQIPFIKDIMAKNYSVTSPVIANVTNNVRNDLLQLVDAAIIAGADSLILTRSYNTDDDIFFHFSKVRDVCPDLPIFLHASRRLEAVTAEEIIKLGKIGLINGVVWSRRPNQDIISEIMTVMDCNERFMEDFPVLSDRDDDHYALTMLGIRGVISKVANLVPLVTEMLKDHQNSIQGRDLWSVMKMSRMWRPLIHLISRDNGRYLLYCLSEMHPEVYGKTPVLPSDIQELSMLDIEELRHILRQYNLHFDETRPEWRTSGI